MVSSRVVLFAMFAASACASSESVICGDIVCPDGYRCGPANECVPATCGDGVLQPDEACDVALPIDATCLAFGFYEPGELSCTPTCQVDTTGCSLRCGDHEANGPETCDGLPPTGQSCTSFGRDIGPIGCAAGCAPDLRDCGTLGWHFAPGTATGTLNAIWGTDLEHMYAVGVGGAIVHRVAGVWTPMASPTNAELFGVWGDAPDHVYAVGASGTILELVAGVWQQVSSPVTSNLYGIDGANGQVFVVGGNLAGTAGVILERTGSTWAVMTLSSPAAGSFNAIDAHSQIAVGDGGLVYERTNGTWGPMQGLPTETSNLRDVASHGQDITIVGRAGRVLQRRNGVWSTDQAPVVAPSAVVAGFESVWIAETGDTFIGANSGLLWRYDGVNFTNTSTNALRTCRDVFGLAPQTVFTLNGGEVLELEAPARRRNLVDATGASIVTSVAIVEGIAIAGNTSGQIFRRVALDMNGWQLFSGSLAVNTITSVWTEGRNVAVGSEVLRYSTTGFDSPGSFVQPSGVEFVRAIAGTATDLYAVGSVAGNVLAARIYHASDPLGTWNTELADGPRFNGLWTTTGGVAVAVGYLGRIVRRTPAGTWLEEDAGTSAELTGVWGPSADLQWAVGKAATLLRYDGTRWRPIPLPTSENLDAIGGTSATDVLVVGTSGVMFHFDGTTWSQLSRPSTHSKVAVTRSQDETIVVGDLGEAVELLTTCGVDELRCADAWDDDCDGLINCADPDCAQDVACQTGGACRGARPITCGETIATTTFSGIARIDDLDCLDSATRGTETTFTLTAPASGTLTATLVGDPVLDLALAPVRTGTAACDLDRCVGATAVASGREVTFDVEAGEVYYLVVDGPLGVGAAFELSLACP